MMNSSSFNTGSYPDRTGFYGNTIYRPGAQGKGAGSSTVDYDQPVMTEDWNILETLNAYYNGRLYLVKRLLQAAQEKGLTTAIVGKSGAAFMFDLDKKGCGIDENAVFPRSFASELQAAGFALPKNTPVMWPDVRLGASNGNPTDRPPPPTLADGVTSDPKAGATSPNASANRYMMDVYLKYILPAKRPDLSVIWLRDPDTKEHIYGVGSKAYVDALTSMDTMLGQLIGTLKNLHVYDSTDIIVASDHGHSNVSGDLSLFPLRSISDGSYKNVGPEKGFSVSGDVRLAQLLADNGVVEHVYDGGRYKYDPVLSGILADGAKVYPDRIDTDGSVTGKAGSKYTTRSFVVPSSLPSDAVIIAANGGSDYLYVPSKNGAIVRGCVRFLQQREEFGAIFVDDTYGALPGTLPMSAVRLENTAGRNPDIVVSYSYDENAVIQGVRGTEYESMMTNRGMHGSFSPIDVNNTLVVSGPDFKKGVISTTPSGNIDVAPTVAYLLGLSLPDTDGRVLHESLSHTSVTVSAVAMHVVSRPPTASGLTFHVPTAVKNSPSNSDRGKSFYRIDLSTSTARDSTGKSVTYFDYAKAVRQ
jgi:arylsulfatase A-like enzyme